MPSRQRSRWRGRGGPAPAALFAVALALLPAARAEASGGGEGSETPPAAAEDDDWARQREEMVSSQIRARGVSSPQVLEALLRVKRHLFVPEAQRSSSYQDYPLPIGYGQTISQPYIVAFMTEILELEPTDTVLEVGTGSGYQAAVLAELAAVVCSIEIVPELAARARETLDGAGYGSVLLRSGDGYWGWEERGPFDAIIVTAAADHVPPPLLAELKPGGRMVIPVGPAGGAQVLLLLTKNAAGKVESRRTLDVRFVPFTRAATP